MLARYARRTVCITAMLLLLVCCRPAATPIPPPSTAVPPTSTVAPSPVPPTATVAQTPAPTTLPIDNGGLIAFYSERDGNAEIYTIHADGSTETRLTNNRALDIAPDLSPDGSQIVFVSDRDGNEEIYRMNSDGSGVVRLTTAPARDSYPFWSADGTKIIFCSQRDDGRTYEVYLINGDGTNPTRITNNSVSEEWAYLSPDMQKIVYAVGPFPDYSLYVMNVDGSDQHQVFSSDKMAAFPKWSRDGRTIAFNHAILSSGRIIGDICLVDQDGSDLRQITTTDKDFVSEGAYWSPDGNRIVFQSNRTGNFQIYVMNADGSDIVRLTNHRGNDFYPSWGPAATSKPGSIRFEKSAQTFAPIPTYQIGLADLDGDGDLDGVFSNGQANDSEVWLNDGSGFFTDSGQQLGRYGHGVNVGDLDGDGDPDLLINTHRESAPSRVYLNDGQAAFQELVGAFQVNIGFNVHLFDLDGDGDLDAVGEAASAANVYWNDGTGAFSASETTFPLTTIWGDLDADGDVDVLVKEKEVGYAVHLNDGRGRFDQHWSYADDAAMDLGDMVLGDVDSDGDLDVVITNGHFQTTSHPAMVFINDGTGQFTDSDQRLSAVSNAGAGLGDLDGDGDLDLVLTDHMQPCQIWLNDGAGRFVDSGFRFGDDHFYRHVHLGDLDGDGDLDIFLATFGTDQGPNEIWFNITQGE